LSHALAHAAFSEIISPFCIVIQSDTGHSHRRPVSPVKSRTSARTLGVNNVYLRGMRVAVVMIFCSFTPAPLPCPLFHNCASLTRRPSTNPHFGVFLPPVALVGDLMQSPVAVRLQVNQVRTFLRNCDPSLLWRSAVDVAPSYSRLDSGCYRAVWGVHQRLLIVQRQLMLGLAVMVSKVVRCSTVT
jgi:hypothetical protein